VSWGGELGYGVRPAEPTQGISDESEKEN
jgi:hypothetical protein